jgi:hypothetical protein
MKRKLKKLAEWFGELIPLLVVGSVVMVVLGVLIPLFASWFRNP